MIFLSEFIYTAVVLHHGDDYYEKVSVSWRFTYNSRISDKECNACMSAYDLYMMLRG